MSTQQSLEHALNRLSHVLSKGADHIDNLRRLSGGASQETWAFDAVDANGNISKLILRRAPGGGTATKTETAIGLSGEAVLIDRAAKAGVPVPEVVHICVPDDGIGDAFIMAHVEGETIARKILRDEEFAAARSALPAQCGKALAGIHAQSLEGLPVVESSGLHQLAQYEEVFRGFNVARPVFELAFRWLKDNAPVPLAPVLVHGDFRLGNLMVDDRGLASVLDWELAHSGDPREDLAWGCINSWRFGASHNRFAGIGTLETVLDAYSAAGGQNFVPKDIDWWEMLGSLKWGVMCMMMYESYRNGTDPSVEKAAIGRRVSETEIDLINLLEAV